MIVRRLEGFSGLLAGERLQGLLLHSLSGLAHNELRAGGGGFLWEDFFGRNFLCLRDERNWLSDFFDGPVDVIDGRMRHARIRGKGDGEGGAC